MAKGHSVVVLGHEYERQPHDYPFTLVPSTVRTMRSQIEAIKQAMWPDYLLFSWDVPAQKQLTEWFAGKGTAQYVGIFPIEGGPLKEIEEWVGFIRAMDKAFVISRFGLRECQEAGLENVSFLPVGVDSDFWQPPTPEYRSELRRDIRIDDHSLEDKFIVITVADNHFRKNLAAGVQIIAEVVREVPNVHYLLISRPHQRSLGWSLRELAARYGIEDRVSVIHSRPTNDMLLRFYQMADAYLCTSHAEGLGLPLLEAMACGVPCVAGDWTAMTELLECGRGLLISKEDSTWFCDPFGNEDRWLISINKAAEALCKLAANKVLHSSIREQGLLFAKERNYDLAVKVLLEGLGVKEAVLA